MNKARNSLFFYERTINDPIVSCPCTLLVLLTLGSLLERMLQFLSCSSKCYQIISSLNSIKRQLRD